jgi:expansin (peptidoglycan-binding protein)
MKACTISLVALAAGTIASPVPGNVKRVDHKRQDDNHGAMTYYEVGLGACGHDDSGKGDSENIVAMSAELMGNSNHMCGRKINITGKDGQTIEATVRDKCPSCSPGELDVSNKVFKEIVGDLGVGRSKVSWSFAQ